ncbi:MAG: hypothetical protein AAGK32_15125, partial [Actinomycetota bacterium]
MKTKICDLLDVEFPILAFTHCRDVVAAVTRAGGYGVLGAAGHSLVLALVLGRHDDVDPEGAVTDLVGDPLEIDVELLGG